MKKESVLKGLEPQKVFDYFERITQIPHGSGNEKVLSDYIVSQAQDMGYEVKQDAAYNVIVEIPASPGYEGGKKTIVQAHIDMVCSKTEDSLHDFEKDPLDICIDGAFIRARNTTLGADDGSGVAIMLAMMADEELKHPPLQLLFTTGEEIMFVGAKAMDEYFLDGEQLIGLDCSSAQTIVVSCAGISVGCIQLPLTKEPLENKRGEAFFRISIQGLLGGHSGNMIHTGRVNGIKLLGELLSALGEKMNYKLLSVESPGLINIINKAAAAEICCEAEVAEEVENLIQELFTEVKNVYKVKEPGLLLMAERRNGTCLDHAYDAETKKNLLQMLEVLPYGVRTMMPDRDMAESSMNCGYLLERNNVLELGVSVRSNSEYQHDGLLRELRYIAEAADGEFLLDSRSAAWEYDPGSPLQKRAKAIYERINGESPELKTLHASVEASVFVEKMKKRNRSIDIINIGCDQYDVHTPRERLKISSVDKTYKFLKAILEASE